MAVMNYLSKTLVEGEYEILLLDDIKEFAEEIAGQWHDSLRARDNDPAMYRAEIANDIIEKCNELQERIQEMCEIWTKTNCYPLWSNYMMLS